MITAEKILPLILRFRISPSGPFWRITQPAASAIKPYGERARAGKEGWQNDARPRRCVSERKGAGCGRGCCLVFP